MNHKQLIPADVGYAIGGELMVRRIVEAMLAKGSVTELLQNFPTVRVALTKCYILHSTKGKDEDGVDCESQFLLPTLFGRSNGMVTTRVIWGNQPPRSSVFDDLGEAVVHYCILVNNAPTASLSRV